MFVIRISMVIAFLGASVWAQQPAAEKSAPPLKTFTSSADVMALVAKAKAERKADQYNFSQRLLQFAPYSVNLEYRPIVGPASVHEKEAEVFYVVDGSGTMVIGGKLVNETRTNPENLSGTAIEGGKSQTIAKGDFIAVPENVPHWFSAIDGQLVLMTFHVPRPLPQGH